MSLGKLTGIKGLVSSSQNRRRFKSDLSVDMISPPLGDFRHTMHVGRGGDVFGDTSFLSNHGGVNGDRGPGSPESSTSASKTTRFFSRTLRHVRKSPTSTMRRGSRDLSLPPPPISPIIKNAISLPQLNLDSPNGGLQRALLPSSISSPEDSLYSYGVKSGFLTLPRLSRQDRQLTDTSGTFSMDFHCDSFTDNGEFALTRSESLTSFTVDLGPSLMSEVLGLIDSSISLQTTNHSLEEDDEEEPSSVFEMALESPSMLSVTMAGSVMGENVTSRGRCSSEEWAEKQTGEHESGESAERKPPDASLAFPLRAEPVMEAEKFQQAADVLARHYGGGALLKGQRWRQEKSRTSMSGQRRAPYAFPEEEEEIKV
ncbi:cdc42 effector protein 1b [Chanos chanos]|uniref:Cdc42 effector protein 1b n=1 Tax=Chanos chanos TaxID=29144 RepID=A0A6J2X0F5_CHACN|nr:cdc42 effector protein 1-like [Chanos chanos]